MSRCHWGCDETDLLMARPETMDTDPVSSESETESESALPCHMYIFTWSDLEKDFLSERCWEM